MAVDNIPPRGGDTYMDKRKERAKLKAGTKLYAESYAKMQRWYHLQRFARDVLKTLETDEAVDLFIDNARHELARMIPSREDIA